jgi:hypothetical protein
VHGFELEETTFHGANITMGEYANFTSFICDVDLKTFLPHNKLDESERVHKDMAMAKRRAIRYCTKKPAAVGGWFDPPSSSPPPLLFVLYICYVVLGLCSGGWGSQLIVPRHKLTYC